MHTYFFLIISVLAFGVMWRGIHKFFLPKAIVDIENKSNYDERQNKMFIEILAKSFIGLVFALLLAFIFRLSGLIDDHHSLIGRYPEAVFLIIMIVMVAMSYFSITRKYTP